jgi:phasin
MTETSTSQGRKIGRAAAAAMEDNIEAASETLRSEMPSSFVDLFEKSLARTKDMHHKVAAVFEHSTEALEEAVSCATRGSAEYRVKLMEIARQNANTAFDLAREAFEAKSPSELLELTLAHQRKQFELATAQLKELSALTQKVVTETTEPIRNGMTEPFRIAS